MAFYDWNNDPELPEAKLYDAEGNEIRSALQCDTDTGEVWHMPEEITGDCIIEIMKVKYPPPLKVYFLKD